MIGMPAWAGILHFILVSSAVFIRSPWLAFGGAIGSVLEMGIEKRYSLSDSHAFEALPIL